MYADMSMFNGKGINRRWEVRRFFVEFIEVYTTQNNKPVRTLILTKTSNTFPAMADQDLDNGATILPVQRHCPYAGI